jgi:undecaprenyl-diphosphatase
MKINKIIDDAAQKIPLWHVYNLALFSIVLALTLFIAYAGINQSLFLYINHYHGLVPDYIWEAINLVAYSRFFILPTGLILLTIVFRRQYLGNVLGLIVMYYILFSVLKYKFAVDRPYVVLSAGSFYWINLFENALRSAHQSFPSGHCGNMAIFVFALNYMFFAKNKLLQFCMLLLLILCALARICSGWHWPLDVLSSGLLGFLLVKLCFRLEIKRYY